MKTNWILRFGMALGFLWASIPLFAANDRDKIPEAFWNSVLLVREGVLDLGESFTVGSLFRNPVFLVSTNLDGTITTVREGPVTFSGNEVTFVYDVLSGETRKVSLLYKLHYSPDGYTLLSEMALRRQGDVAYQYASNFQEKLSGLLVFQDLCVDQTASQWFQDARQAIERRDLAALETLLNDGDVNAENEGRSLLSFCTNDEAAALLLLRYGADPNISLADDRDFLSCAIATGSLPLVRACLINHAEVDPGHLRKALFQHCDTKMLDLLVLNGLNGRALLWACQAANTNGVRYFLRMTPPNLLHIHKKWVEVNQLWKAEEDGVSIVDGLERFPPDLQRALKRYYKKWKRMH